VFEKLLTALNAKPSGKGYKAMCPAHEDTKASLSLVESESGKVLFHCFAGCAQSEVLRALRQLGLWPTARKRKRSCR